MMRFAVIFLLCCAMAFAIPRNDMGRSGDQGLMAFELLTGMMEDLRDEGKTH